jgi:hypothetical protein
MSRLAAFSLLFSLCCCLGGCTGLPFHPSKTILATPDTIGLSYEDVRIRTEDGETIAGWFLPAPAAQAASPPAGGRPKKRRRPRRKSGGNAATDNNEG